MVMVRKTDLCDRMVKRMKGRAVSRIICVRLRNQSAFPGRYYLRAASGSRTADIANTEQV